MIGSLIPCPLGSQVNPSVEYSFRAEGGQKDGSTYLGGCFSITVGQFNDPLVNLDAQEDALVCQQVHQRLAIGSLLVESLLEKDLPRNNTRNVIHA